MDLPEILIENGFSLDKHVFRYRSDNIIYDESERDNYRNGHSLNEIEFHEIWHSAIGALNDPFEVYASANENEYDELTDEEFNYIWLNVFASRPESGLLGHSKDYLEEFYRANKDVVKARIKEYMSDKVFFSQFISEIRNLIAISSFTRVCDSRLMWGYYCNGLAGMCLIYNIEKLQKSGVFLSEVSYQLGGYKLNLFDFMHSYRTPRTNELLTNIPKFKHEEWSHEHELRSIKPLSEGLQGIGEKMTIDGGCLDGVIIGKRTNIETIKRIRKLSRKQHFKVFMADADLDNFKIEIYQ